MIAVAELAPQDSAPRVAGRLPKAVSVAHEVLRGYGQIVFCGRRRSGALVLLATLLWPLGGLCGLLGAAAASLMGRRLPNSEVLSAPGLYACNGALTGIGLAVYGPHAWAPLLAAVAGALAGVLVYVLSRPLGVLHLPPLSLPFVFATWIMHGLVPPVPVPLAAAPPSDAAHALHVLGLVVFAWSAAAGVLLLAAVALHARVQALVMAASLPVMIWVASWATGNSPVVPAATLNMVLAAVAISVVFVPNRPWLGLAGAACALGVTEGLQPFASATHLPLLVAPFNVATLLVLLYARHAQRVKLLPAPVDRPAEVVASADVQLSPPFFGRWTVSQGPNGQPTHQGEGRYAWDFVVTDDKGRTHKNLGLRLDDYYAFGIPVRAPVDGVVVARVADVVDNPPPRENRDDQWGNYVIIAQAPGAFVMVAHFQCDAIDVQVGQTVARGQIIGRCGNSGRSLEPHIHVQLQTGDYPGAPSVPASFVGCRIGQEPAPRGVGVIPDEGEVVEALS